jgi:hypothetical protein
MVQHTLSTLLYGMIGYSLMLAIFVGFWRIRAVRIRQPKAIAAQLEPTIREWLYDLGLNTKPVLDEAWHFGLLTTLPSGELVYILQLKEHRRFIAFQTNLAVPPEHQAILKAMPKAYFDELTQELVLKVFLAKMVLAIRTQLSNIALFSQLAIDGDFKQEAFLKQLDDMDNAIILARNTISRGAERAPRLVSHRDVRTDERR